MRRSADEIARLRAEVEALRSVLIEARKAIAFRTFDEDALCAIDRAISEQALQRMTDEAQEAPR